MRKIHVCCATCRLQLYHVLHSCLKKGYDVYEATLEQARCLPMTKTTLRAIYRKGEQLRAQQGGGEYKSLRCNHSASRKRAYE